MSLLARRTWGVSFLDRRLGDRGLALALTLWAIAQPGSLEEPTRVVLLAMTVAIAWRRSAPVAVLTTEVAGIAVAPSGLDWADGVALLVAAYSAALYGERRAVVLGLLLAAAAWILAFGTAATIPRALIPFLLLAPAWLAGRAMRQHAQIAAAFTERAERLEIEREVALQAERARIARELHDVVTHSVTVMVLQSGAARQIMAHDQTRAKALLESVETSGRTALEELRRLLGLLSDRSGDAPLSPQPGLADIPGLVEQARQVGLPVELCIEGRPRAISGGVAVAAYRIVQEALTNALKHATGTPTRVVVRWTDATLELEIRDDGTNRRASRRGPSGRGLAGMRERAAMYGGILEAGPEPDRGYLVRAHIPLEPPG